MKEEDDRLHGAWQETEGHRVGVDPKRENGDKAQ